MVPPPCTLELVRPSVPTERGTWVHYGRGTSIIRSMAVGNMTDTIKKGMKDVTNAVKHAAEKGKDAAVGAVDKGKVVAAQGAEKVKEQTDRAAEKVKEA